MKTLSMNYDEFNSKFTILNDQQLNAIKGGSNCHGEDDDDDTWMSV